MVEITEQEKLEFQPLIKEIEKLFSKNHITYEQSAYIIKAIRDNLSLKPSKKPRTVIQHLTPEECKRLLDYAYKMQGERGLIIKTLFFTGARVNEFINIKKEHIYFDECKIFIEKGKRGKQRFVPIPLFLRDELKTYLDGKPKNVYLFENNRGTHYSTMRIWQMVREVATNAGLIELEQVKGKKGSIYKYKLKEGKPIFPHILRHSIATFLLEKGMPLDQVQAFLGHEDPKTTEIYAKTSLKGIQESYNKALEYKPM